jgi:hypothetical protein
MAAPGTPFRAVAEQYGRDALEVLRGALDSKDFRTRFQAARDLAALVIRMVPQKGPMEEVAGPLTQEERDAKMTAAIESPDVREWMIARGWTPPPGKTPARKTVA